MEISSKVLQENTKLLLIAARQTELRKIKALEGGFVNNTYLLELCDDSKLVLKVWANKNPAFVEQVIRNTFFLADYGVPTPLPLSLNKDKRIMVIDGLSWILMPYICGRWLSPEPSSLYILGRIQAKLHQIPVNEDIPQSYAYGYNFWDDLIENSLSNGVESPFIKMLKKESAELKKNIPENLPKGIIHGDLKLENTIASKEKILAVLDLEDMCFDWLSLDIAMTFAHCGWENGQPVKRLWESLLEGYQSIRLLEVAEKKALPYLHKYSILALAAWRYRQYVLKKSGTNLKKRYLEMADRLNKDLIKWHKSGS